MTRDDVPTGPRSPSCAAGSAASSLPDPTGATPPRSRRGSVAASSDFPGKASADRLRRARKHAGLRAFDLSAVAQLPLGLVLAYLEGDRDLGDNPSALRKIAAALDCSPSWLATGEPSPAAQRLLEEFRIVCERGGRMSEEETARLGSLLEMIPSGDELYDANEGAKG